MAPWGPQSSTATYDSTIQDGRSSSDMVIRQGSGIQWHQHSWVLAASCMLVVYAIFSTFTFVLWLVQSRIDWKGNVSPSWR